MRMTMLASAAAIALAASIGSVSAEDQHATLSGIEAAPMSSGELDAIKGMDHHFELTNPGQGVEARHDTDQFQDANGEGNFKLISFPQYNPDGSPELDGDGNQVVTTRLAAPSYSGLKHACANSLINGNGVVTGPGFLC